MAHGSPKGHRKLTFKHRIAVNAFLSGMSKKDAMLEAGYAKSIKSDFVFSREDVRHEVERRQEKVAAKYDVSQEWVVERLVRMAESNTTLAKFIKVDEEGQLDWDFTGATIQELALIEELAVKSTIAGGYEMKIATPSRQKAIDSLCRILGFNKDKLDLTGSLSLVERLQRGRGRVRKGEGDE